MVNLACIANNIRFETGCFVYDLNSRCAWILSNHGRYCELNKTAKYNLASSVPLAQLHYSPKTIILNINYLGAHIPTF